MNFIKNRKKIIISICFFILFFLFISALSISLYYKKNLHNTNKDLQYCNNVIRESKKENKEKIIQYKKEINSLSTFPKSSVSPSQTFGWSTYTNKKNNFKIDFPNNYILDLEREQNDTIYLRTQGRQSDLDKNIMIQAFDVMITILKPEIATPNDDSRLMSLEERVNLGVENNEIIKKEDIIIDGAKGYSGISKGMIGNSYMEIFEHNRKTYLMKNNGSLGRGDIIKSFRFIK